MNTPTAGELCAERESVIGSVFADADADADAGAVSTPAPVAAAAAETPPNTTPTGSPSAAGTEAEAAVTGLSERGVESPEFTMRAIPEVSHAQLSRRFEIDLLNIEVTSVDMVAHGCYVLAGCSNGMILLFDMSSTSRSGVIIAHIRAKGLHTNLLLTVKVTEDSRFCFAGVHKGSMEMIALDLSRLPGWPEKEKGGGPPKRVKEREYHELITKSSRMDSKLRGFGAVVRVQAARGTIITTTDDTAKYILACGRGIKNVHIWTFTPDAPDGPQWSFVYDVASNGNTIESVGFRDGGRQAMSKSAGMCVRVWNMAIDGADSPPSSPSPAPAPGSDDGDEEAGAGAGAQDQVSAKLPYEDITNSHDVRAFADCFGFGGTYEFALVKLDAPRWANRYTLTL
jgi:hypothetical protein